MNAFFTEFIEGVFRALFVPELHVTNDYSTFSKIRLEAFPVKNDK